MQDLHLLKEAIYEASVLLEDPAPYFEEIERIMDNQIVRMYTSTVVNVADTTLIK